MISHLSHIPLSKVTVAVLFGVFERSHILWDFFNLTTIAGFGAFLSRCKLSQLHCHYLKFTYIMHVQKSYGLIIICKMHIYLLELGGYEWYDRNISIRAEKSMIQFLLPINSCNTIMNIMKVPSLSDPGIREFHTPSYL